MAATMNAKKPALPTPAERKMRLAMMKVINPQANGPGEKVFGTSATNYLLHSLRGAGEQRVELKT